MPGTQIQRAPLSVLKQKTAYEIYQCDGSSDVCSSDLHQPVSAAVSCELRPLIWEAAVAMSTPMPHTESVAPDLVSLTEASALFAETGHPVAPRTLKKGAVKHGVTIHSRGAGRDDYASWSDLLEVHAIEVDRRERGRGSSGVPSGAEPRPTTPGSGLSHASTALGIAMQ